MEVNMDNGFKLEPVRMQMLAEAKELSECNKLTTKYGLSLSEAQIQNLVEHRFGALRDTGRVEFGEGILKKLIYAFCDSPYISQENYEETILELQDSFLLLQKRVDGPHIGRRADRIHENCL